MKKFFTVTALCIVCVLSFAQGKVNFMSYDIGYVSDRVGVENIVFKDRCDTISTVITITYVNSKTLFYEKGQGYYLIGFTFYSDKSKNISQPINIGKDKKTALWTLDIIKESLECNCNKTLSVDLEDYNLVITSSGETSLVSYLEKNNSYLCLTHKNIDDIIELINKNKSL